MEDILKYPIGKFSPQESYSENEILAAISRIEALPAKVEAAVKGLSASQLDTPYRDGGWTVRQVVHHLADSHMNAYIRFKWTITEETPTIKAYNEKAWAETPETSGSPELSINLLKPLHTKWVTLLKGLKSEQLKREYTHPETKKNAPLERIVNMYAWHGEHHLAHITELKKRKGWG
jgi:hypothetical protein